MPLANYLDAKVEPGPGPIYHMSATVQVNRTPEARLNEGVAGIGRLVVWYTTTTPS